ncbi:hypothetical protein KSF73_14455 [Burkholderiaceae bacterium DAT-1]|nr:hypothetical protein [Burkholderiaceae bacterium DAT-1]
MTIPPWLYVAAALVLLAIVLSAWSEMRRADLIAARKRKIREALANFSVSRTIYVDDHVSEVFLYSAANSRRLLELNNEIVRYGHGSAQWLYFVPERKLFFILELVAIDPEDSLHFIQTVHPIKPARARQVLVRHPDMYAQLFGEHI